MLRKHVSTSESLTNKMASILEGPDSKKKLTIVKELKLGLGNSDLTPEEKKSVVIFAAIRIESRCKDASNFEKYYLKIKSLVSQYIQSFANAAAFKGYLQSTQDYSDFLKQASASDQCSDSNSLVRSISESAYSKPRIDYPAELLMRVDMDKREIPLLDSDTMGLRGHIRSEVARIESPYYKFSLVTVRGKDLSEHLEFKRSGWEYRAHRPTTRSVSASIVLDRTKEKP